MRSAEIAAQGWQTRQGSRLTICGVSNMLSDILDCALARGYRDFLVVTNTSEVLRPRTRPFRERLTDLPPGATVEVLPLDRFPPDVAGDVFLGTSAPQRYHLWRQLRERWAVRLCTLVHPAATVSPMAKLAEGVFVGAGSVIGPCAEVHLCVFINRAASVGHDTTVGPFARVQPGAHVGGHVRVGAFATIGIGATVIEEVIIGDNAWVAAGAVVTRDVAAGHFFGAGRSVARSSTADEPELPSWVELQDVLPPPLRAVGDSWPLRE